MVDRSKKIVARFYETAAGRRPVREWLLSLSKDDRRIVGRDIEKKTQKTPQRDIDLALKRKREIDE